MPLGDSLRDVRAAISITLCLSTKRKHSISKCFGSYSADHQSGEKTNQTLLRRALFLTFSLPISRPPARLRVRSPAAAAAAEESGGVVVDAKLVTCNMVGSEVELRNVKNYF